MTYDINMDDEPVRPKTQSVKDMSKVKPLSVEEAADLVGEAGPEADDAGGEVDGEGHRRDIDLGEEFYLVHCLFF